MITANSDVSTIKETSPRAKEFRRFMRVFFGRAVVSVSMVLLIIYLIVAAFAPLVAPYDPYKTNFKESLEQPSAKHLLGTDSIGRDILSRVIYGSRLSLLVGVIAVSISAIVGMLLGLVAGYYGSWIEVIIMRVMDALMAFPMILLAMLISGLLGGGMVNVMIALGIALIPGYARVMCGQVLSLKENDYILAGRSVGAGNMRMMFRHFFPNCIPPLIVLMTMMMGTTMLAEAGLSFLGIGIEAPQAAWGSMVNDGYPFLLSNPLLSVAPGLALMLVVLSFNMAGDGLRDALDPRLRGMI
jgi:peptide/nickel transport system permease protein